jgi:hypothetical protein
VATTPVDEEKDRKLAEAIRALTDASREQSKRLADAANQMVRQAAVSGTAPDHKKARPKTTAGKLWAAVKPAATRAFNRAAGRLAKSVSWYGRKGSWLAAASVGHSAARRGLRPARHSAGSPARWSPSPALPCRSPRR